MRIDHEILSGERLTGERFHLSCGFYETTCFLFREYSELLTEDQLWWLKDRASSVFDWEVLSALLPDVFESD